MVRGSPEIEVETSLTAFVRRVQSRDPTGPEIRLLKDQMGRLATALIRLAIAGDQRGFQVDSKIVGAFDLWFPKDRQRVLWPQRVRLGLEYFESLQRHAVPLDEGALAVLAHSAMALDLYAWLAQRLHRVKLERPQFVTWKALKDQFGVDYERVRDFRRVFRRTLSLVLSRYRATRLDADEKGLTLHHSAPPVRGHLAVVRRS